MARSRASLSVALSLVVLVIAGRADADTQPTVQPVPEAAPPNASAPAPGSTIKWNDESATPTNAAPAPSASGTVSPSAPAPGSTIKWNDEPATPSNAAPAPSASGTVSPSAPTPNAPPPGATKLPPGTIVPPPDSADSGSIHWNSPQPPPSTVPGAPVGPNVSWRSEFRGGVIWVEVIDPESFYRVEQINLVAPDGQSFAAFEISRTQARYDYTADSGNVGVGAWGGSHHSGAGIGIGFPLNRRGYERADNATHSVARFQLANPAVYRRTAANWSVLVRLVDRNGHPSVARFPAPLPGRR